MVTAQASVVTLLSLHPTSKGLSISHYVQRLTFQWITLSTLTAVMLIARPDIDNWVRDRAPKFVSRASFKNLNRWHRVFDADRHESIAFLLQFCLGLGYFCYYGLPKWSAVLWTFGCCERAVHEGRDRGRRRARVCLEQRCSCVVVLVGGCFLCSVSGAVDFSLSSSYFFWVVWNLVYQEQLVSWRASRLLFGLHDENFDFIDERAGLCPCGEVRRRLCLSIQGVLEIFFWHLLERQLTLVLEFGVHRCGCLGVDVQSDSAEVHYVRFCCLWKISPAGESARLCVEERWWPIILDPHPRGRPCRVANVLPSIRLSAWSTVEKRLFLFGAAAESALAVQV